MSNETTGNVDLKKIADGVRLMLEGMGEDPDREGLQKTPARVADFYAELTDGMWQDAKSHIQALPGDSHDEMVIVSSRGSPKYLPGGCRSKSVSHSRSLRHCTMHSTRSA